VIIPGELASDREVRDNVSFSVISAVLDFPLASFSGAS